MTARLPGDAGIGRVALRVADADASAEFYERTLGLAPVEPGEWWARDPDRAKEGKTTWIGAGGRPLVGLVEAPDAPGRGDDEAGLFHLAIRVPTRTALADVVARVRAAGGRLAGASDHLVSEAVYLSDPAGNGLEVYRDRPREEWQETADGEVRMATLPLDVPDLLAAAEGPPMEGGIHPGADVGHVHLETAAMDRAVAFYRADLGMAVRARQGSAATFLAAGDYHHHVGLNRWRGRSAPADPDSLGLDWFEVRVPSGDLGRLRERLDEYVPGAGDGDSGANGEGADDGFTVRDPDGIRVRISPR